MIKRPKTALLRTRLLRARTIVLKTRERAFIFPSKDAAYQATGRCNT